MARTALLLALVPVVHAASGWVMTWEDDFNGPSINSSNWNVADNMTHGDQEWQLYLDDEVYVEGGNLVLRTRERQAYYGSKLYNWTSGWVDSRNKVSQLFGRFSVRAKLPNPASISIWPAHWLMPQDASCWPDHGEIDIMEAVGGLGNNTVFGTYHWGAKCGVDEWDNYNQAYPNITGGNRPINYSLEYHVFSVAWNATEITWFVDDVAYESRFAGQPASLFIPQWPMYWILNTAIAFWYGPQPPKPSGVYPVYHYIDWVRMYEWYD